MYVERLRYFLKKRGMPIRELTYEELPDEVKKMFYFEEINWVEGGLSPQLETIRGYHWDYSNRSLKQLTGSKWSFCPVLIYVKTSTDIETKEFFDFCSLFGYKGEDVKWEIEEE